MCGIVAILQREGRPVDQELVLSMTRRLVHRGPDDEGTFIDGTVGLGFRRLAILDLTPTGHQPMVSPDGNVVLIVPIHWRCRSAAALLFAMGQVLRRAIQRRVGIYHL